MRIVTVPNVITLVRLGCLPVFVWLLFGLDKPAGAALLLGMLGITDWVDGWIARRFDQQSDFGALFDPIVDRLLFLVAAVAVSFREGIPVWFFVAVLAREIAVGSMMIVGQLLGMERFPVTTLGKRYTFLLMMAIPLLLLGTSGHVTADVAWITGWVLGIPGLVLSFVTGVDYVPRVRRAVRAGRANRGVR
jgi:cardiolipin synthase